MEGRVGTAWAAGAVVVALGAAVGVWLWGLPPFSPAAPAWWLLVAVAVAYWLGMLAWSRGRP